MRRLKQAVESSWATSPTTTPTECCKIANSSKRREYDSRFRNKVDFTSLCVKVSESAPSYRQYVADSRVQGDERYDKEISSYQVAILCI